MSKGKTNYREVLAERLSNLKSCFLLDAGTGAGSMTKVLAKRLNVHVVSADVNRRVFPTVRRRVDRQKVDFIVCDFASLPFKDESLCCIVCDLVISTSQNWRPLPMCKEFNRTLRRKGILSITDYYPETAPRKAEERMAAETWKFYREVSKASNSRIKRDFPPAQTIADIRKAGFNGVRKRKMIANESAQWKKRVFAEYYAGIRNLISSMSGPILKTTFLDKLDALKKDIVAGTEIRWSWGVNYLIEARK